MKNLIYRTLSGILFVVVLAGAVFLSDARENPIWSIVVMSVFLCVSLLELKNIVHHSLKKAVFLSALGEVFFIASVLAFNMNDMKWWALLYFMFVISLLCLVLIGRKIDTHKFAFTFTASLYIIIPFIFFISYFDISQSLGFRMFVIPLCHFVTLWTGDTFAYLVGSLTGKHKMLPKVSPKKSWEGFFGGLVAVVVLGFLFDRWFPCEAVACNDVFWFVFVLIIYFTGTLGDFMESFVKRVVNVKDSGNFMPGHGGAIDRFDSFLLSVPFVTIFLLTLIL